MLDEIRKLAARRSDGLLTSDQLARALDAVGFGLDGWLREMEAEGIIGCAPSTGRIAVILMAESDARALRRAARADETGFDAPVAPHPGEDDPEPDSAAAAPGGSPR